MIIWEVIFIILINFSIAKCQQSCSGIANFYSDYYGTYGQVQISHVPLQQNSNFGIELSVAARLPSVNSNIIKTYILSNYCLIIEQRLENHLSK